MNAWKFIRMREDVSEEYGNSKNLEEYFHRIVFGNIFFFYSSETPEKLCIVSDTPRFSFGRDRIFLSSSKQDKRIETHLDCLHGRIDMAGSYSRAAEYVTAQQKIIFRWKRFLKVSPTMHRKSILRFSGSENF